jgi:hypothetical protein
MPLWGELCKSSNITTPVVFTKRKFIMADPITFLALASTAITAVGAVQQASAQKAQAEYNSAVARNNSIIAEQNAQDVEQRGGIALAQRRQALSQTIGSARAAIAGSGLLVDDAPETTPAMLLDDLTVAGQMDILTLEGNIAREARRARIQGGEFEAQAGLFGLEARSISPAFAGLSAGLGAASRNSDLLS